METMRVFEGPGIGASVSLVNQMNDLLAVGGDGIIQIPTGVKPNGFHLAILLPKNGRMFVAQKDVGKEKGEYHTKALTKFTDIEGDFIPHIMHEPIQVMRAGKNVWTVWHKEITNRVDCYHIGLDGTVSNFQVGVITHDDGITWRLHGEYRWKGKLFQDGFDIVAKPASPSWGLFQKTWEPVFNLPEFQNLLKDVELQEWDGCPEELDPPLPLASSPDQAVVQWYVPFAGQTGQGIAILHPSQGKTAWVHGIDIQQDPDADGVKRLRRGDVISFDGQPARWGKKLDAPAKLVGVKKVS